MSRTKRAKRAPQAPAGMLETIARQHAELRARITRCDELADRLDAGRIDPDQLRHEVTALRLALDTHNAYEEHVLTPVLLEADWMGAVRTARMDEEHAEEHRAMRRELDTRTTDELRRVLASLRAHLESEERLLPPADPR